MIGGENSPVSRMEFQGPQEDCVVVFACFMSAGEGVVDALFDCFVYLLAPGRTPLVEQMLLRPCESMLALLAVGLICRP